eukprot:CAMPEP_0185741120 /NCGR_PEP_ID=MMETSP1171-20130828/38789_1 /TAXON_ID=374046 /ORGANISM="Helicotheca tamensis, Strain CCMP826" /LENGTH=355 /DNA_ID=CAMNT_0028413069 /DNA_START=1042 /DNA_END=2109 /DNA_ORIENTATION=-
MAKTSRDPGAPKRNMSAYLLYQNAMRDQFKALNPGMTFGQLAKYTSAMYAEMPPAEKEAWVARAEADKARYLHELASYVPPPGYDAKGDAITQGPGKSSSSSRGKSDKDTNAPKRNMSAYLLYQNAMRDQFKRENPGMTFGQLAKYTSHMYKNLTPEEKAMWDARAAQDKARYDAQIAAYVPPPGHDAHGNLLENHRPRKRNKRSPKDPSAPKRASGAYVFFTNEMRPQVMGEYPGIKFVELGRVMGERWRALTPQEKKRYEDMAAEDKVRFQMEMQQYQAGQVVQQHTQEPPPHHPEPHYMAPPQPEVAAPAMSDGQHYGQHVDPQQQAQAAVQSYSSHAYDQHQVYQDQHQGY